MLHFAIVKQNEACSNLGGIINMASAPSCSDPMSEGSPTSNLSPKAAAANPFSLGKSSQASFGGSPFKKPKIDGKLFCYCSVCVTSCLYFADSAGRSTYY